MPADSALLRESKIIVPYLAESRFAPCGAAPQICNLRLKYAKKSELQSCNLSKRYRRNDRPFVQFLQIFCSILFICKMLLFLYYLQRAR